MDLSAHFTDPFLRAPTWGTLFMCIASSLMGVVALLKKRSLLAEALSHAAYPGALIALCLYALFFPKGEEWGVLPLFAGAFASSLVALKAIEWLEIKAGVRSDAALSFVLSLFFAAGIVVASAVQFRFPKWYPSVQALLFGQAATMGDLHIALYAALACMIAFFLVFSFRPLQALLFDRQFATCIGIRVFFWERALSWLFLFSLVIGIRSVGVVLISGMMIAPAVAARQFTDRLHAIFGLAALFGALSGLLGNILSVELSLALSRPEEKLILPTGPAIVLVGTMFALFALTFAPKRGLVFRLARIARFRLRRLEENILKDLWKRGPLSRNELQERHRIVTFPYALARLRWRGLVGSAQRCVELTPKGMRKAGAIVRLHRLWELYLAEELGLRAEHVHKSAEEMEHILTPDLEERLTHLLLNPKEDPHHQPIPEKIR